MNPVYVFDFTASCDKITRGDLINVLQEHTKWWCFQQERGATTGFLHFQGRLKLAKKLRLTAVEKLLPSLRAAGRISATSKACANNDDYVTKDDTRVDGPWRSTDVSKYVPRQIREISELRPWQQQVVDSADIWDTRTINYVIDTRGNRGKSILTTYTGVYGIGNVVPFLNDYDKMMGALYGKPTRRLYVVDMPRAIKKDCIASFMSAIESLKNGHLFDWRHHYKEKFFDCPTVWIFSNTEPDLSMLSNDRWVFWEFSDDSATLIRRGTAVEEYPDDYDLDIPTDDEADALAM